MAQHASLACTGCFLVPQSAHNHAALFDHPGPERLCRVQESGEALIAATPLEDVFFGRLVIDGHDVGCKTFADKVPVARRRLTLHS